MRYCANTERVYYDHTFQNISKGFYILRKKKIVCGTYIDYNANENKNILR